MTTPANTPPAGPVPVPPAQPTDMAKMAEAAISREANECARAIVSLADQRGAHLSMVDCAKIVQAIGLAITAQLTAATAALEIANRSANEQCELKRNAQDQLATARQELDAARAEVARLKNLIEADPHIIRSGYNRAITEIASLRATVATLSEKLRIAEELVEAHRQNGHAINAALNKTTSRGVSEVEQIESLFSQLQTAHAELAKKGGDTLTKLETEMRSIKDGANECASSNPPDGYEALEPGSDALRLADACFQHGMDSMETALSNWIYDQRNAALPTDTKNAEGIQ